MLSLKEILNFTGDEKNLICKGEKLLNSKYLISFLRDGFDYKAEIKASYKTKYYKVHITLDDNEKILHTSCECPKGKYKCSHLLALMLQINKCVSRTDTACKWSIPKGKGDITTAEDVFQGDYHKAIARPITEEDKTTFISQLCDLLPDRFIGLHWINSADHFPHDNQHTNSLIDIISSKSSMEEIISSAKLDVEKIKSIEEETRGQRKNPLWHKMREGRLTASNFGAILNAIGRKSFPPSLFKKLKGEYKFEGARAIKWGESKEKDAIQKFEEVMGMKVKECGIYLHKSGLIGASPDGIIDESTILEAKCPFKYRDFSSLADALKDNDFYLYKIGTEYFLKKSSNYYHQVQGQMHISGTSKCYFIVYVPQDIVIICINLDVSWKSNIEKLLSFYVNSYLPLLICKNNTDIDI